MNPTIIIIDDDPTGCQTVHNVPLLTSWDAPTLAKYLNQEKTIFILSNSRALSPEGARAITLEIASNIRKALNPETDFRIISRSDSTLRGHLAEEVSALLEVFGPFDGTILVPYFKEGGRITIGDEHYVESDGKRLPASETEFAKDPVLGFRSSYLPDYVQERGKGLWKKNVYLSISLEDIREGGQEKVSRKLMASANNIPIFINAENDTDLEIAVKGIIDAEEKGKKFLYRTAASFVRIRSGISSRPLLEPEKKASSCLIVAGSFVDRTTRQLADLEKNFTIEKIEIETDRVIDNDKKDNYLRDIIAKIDQFIRSKKTILVHTERKYRGNGSEKDKIELGNRLSEFIRDIVSNISSQPDLIISKGGITSHVVLKDGLGVKAAIVLGQVEPGVPILKLQKESRFPGSYYVIFPGNVGTSSTLTRIVKKFMD